MVSRHWSSRLALRSAFNGLVLGSFLVLEIDVIFGGGVGASLVGLAEDHRASERHRPNTGKKKA